MVGLQAKADNRAQGFSNQDAVRHLKRELKSIRGPTEVGALLKFRRQISASFGRRT